MEDNKTHYFGAIKDLSIDERPREKAILHGISSLSSAELLAILLGSGSVGESVVDLSRRILKWSDNSLNKLGKRTIGDLKRNFKGVGDAKAILVLASMELGRRYALEGSISDNVPQITNSESAYAIMRYNIGHLNHEEFWVIALNNAKKIITKFRVGQGGLSATVVDPKIIVKTALDNYANSIILYHNHPSGNASPSNQDDMITQKISKAASYLDIPVIDHIIVCENTYYSYADEGRI